ncbi:hypothetical protein GCM10009108_06070 [Castellaniella ginsengisoli]|uniref:Class I SAM-dependent methyltransferase n=2 Tax=Castellaniella ginsengisoli TaxID=546114 RepID=A0ABN1KRU9_9BURK
MLDVGGGNGVHTHFFRQHGFQVDLVDIVKGKPDRVFVGNFLDFTPAKRYDIVWASHVLEHILDPGSFIRHLLHCAKEGGWLCVTVPPAKQEMTFGHVTQWSAGLLLINLIKAGLDCREAKILTHGYNVSILTPVKFRTDTIYTSWLPPEIPIKQGYFDGDIESLNWQTTTIANHLRLKVAHGDSFSETLKELRGMGGSGFVLCMDELGEMRRFHWYDAAFERLVVVA